MFGFKTMLQQMPSLRGFVSALRKGYIPDEGLARQIMVISGFGQEKAASYHRGRRRSRAATSGRPSRPPSAAPTASPMRWT
jgi:hypothetical protein